MSTEQAASVAMGHRARSFGALGRRLRRAPSLALSAWRRSIMVRVVGATLGLSVVVVALLGQIVTNQVRDGLLKAKTGVALAQANSGFRAANLLIAQTSSDLDQGGDNELLTGIPRAATASSSGVFDVALFQPDVGGGPDARRASASRGLNKDSIPPKLIKAVEADSSKVFYQYAMLHYDGKRPVRGLVVGSQLQSPSQPYEMYYAFPLDQERVTLDLVRQRLLTAGALIVLLLGMIAYVVTRQVVTPVRRAARIAERISAGQLDERMRVTGEDDLARLASSFNKMASNLQQQIRQLEDLSRVQRRFVSDVSHELRTPLTTVRMAADVLHEARASFGGHVERSAELLQTQLDRFEALLADLLEISR